MTAQIIDGKKTAETVFASLKIKVGELKKSGVTPGLATVLIGEAEKGGRPHPPPSLSSRQPGLAVSVDYGRP